MDSWQEGTKGEIVAGVHPGEEGPLVAGEGPLLDAPWAAAALQGTRRAGTPK